MVLSAFTEVTDTILVSRNIYITYLLKLYQNNKVYVLIQVKTLFCTISSVIIIFRCGYSQGFVYPWCFVGEAGYDQWRPCDSQRAQLGDR